MEMSTLIIGLFAGALGAGYFVYGKRMAKITPMVTGALLCVYPYFVDGTLWLVLIGVALAAAPFVLDYFLP
jgi:hypothetical protein